MGFGCNACGVTGCRIIDSPRERLIAILTNSFAPCNGRFPLLIFLCAVFFDAGSATLRRLREQLQQPGNHLRLKISSALRRLARRLARSSLSKNFGTRFTTSNRSFRGRQRFPGAFP